MKTSDLGAQFKRYTLLEKGMKVKTYMSICSTIRMLCNFAKTDEIEQLEQNTVRGFLYQGRSERAWKSRTFRNHWLYLKIYFDWCIKSGYLRKNPVAGIEKPKMEKCLPRCVSSEEAKKINYHTAWYPWTYRLERYRNLAIISTLMMTGLRLQELLNLEVSDVNLSSGDILVRQGKGRKDRAIPIHPRLLPILRDYFEKKMETGQSSQWFFTGIRSGKQLTQKDARRICKKISADSGVKFTPHMLRHTFAREMIDNDFNLYKLKEIMGHADITTTQRYLAISVQGIKTSFDQVKIF